VSPLSGPPPSAGALAGFPRTWLEPGTALARIHRHEQSPLWFNSDGERRFDLAPPQGTLYTAADPLGSLVEVFRDASLVDVADVEGRRLSLLTPRRRLPLADCAARPARRFGISGAIHSTPDYATAQAWAAAFRRAGFRGIRYLVSHDPAQRLVGYALFGPAGEGTAEGAIEVLATLEIQRLLLEELAAQFGITVLPPFLEEP
jgi:hypothetical protein